MTAPQDPRHAAWAARLRAAIGEESPSARKGSTYARITRAVARDSIRAVIAELDTPPAARVSLGIDPKAVPPTPPDTVHAEKLAAARARCTHDLVDDGVCLGCACEVVPDA